MGTDAFVVVLETRDVVVRARPAVIEVRQRAGSAGDLTLGGVLLVAITVGTAAATAPWSAATAVLAPFVLLFGALGGWGLAVRLLWPAVHIDCVAWTAHGGTVALRRWFGMPPRAHTTVVRGRYGGTDVVLSAGQRSTGIVERVADAEAEEIARTLRRLIRERTVS